MERSRNTLSSSDSDAHRTQNTRLTFPQYRAILVSTLGLTIFRSIDQYFALIISKAALLIRTVLKHMTGQLDARCLKDRIARRGITKPCILNICNSTTIQTEPEKDRDHTSDHKHHFNQPDSDR